MNPTDQFGRLMQRRRNQRFVRTKERELGYDQNVKKTNASTYLVPARGTYHLSICLVASADLQLLRHSAFNGPGEHWRAFSKATKLVSQAVFSTKFIDLSPPKRAYSVRPAETRCRLGRRSI